MVNEEVQRYYREHFQRVNGQGITGIATAVVHRALERPFTQKHFFPSVLELGSALGGHARFVRHGFDEYILTDIADHGIDLQGLQSTRGTGDGAQQFRFQLEDIHSLSYEEQRFDRVVHTCLLHHLEDPERAMNEVRRVLRLGGVASFHLPCDPGLAYRGLQRITAGRRIRSTLRKHKFSIEYGYLRAVEHRNHYSALIALAQHTFGRDQMRIRHYPLPFNAWNLNLFTIVQVKKIEN